MLRRWLAASRSLAMTMASIVAISAIVITIAVISEGYPVQRVHLNDASVWVSYGAKQFIGRANTQIQKLDTVVQSESSEIDIVQDGGTVLLVDEGSNKVDIIDPATSSVSDSVPLANIDAQVFLAGSNVAVADRDGQVWLVPAEEFEHFDPDVPETLSLGADCVFAMNANGMLIAYSRDAGVLYRIDAAGAGEVIESRPLTFGGARSQLSVSWVGSTWAVLDATSRTLAVGGFVVDLSNEIAANEDLKLQKPVLRGDEVLVAHDGGLLSVSISGGVVLQLVTGMTGTPASPVVVDGCRFAAWTGGTAWRSCTGEQEPALLNLTSMPLGAEKLAFATNGDRVVLNEPRGGGTWAVQSRGQLINNWEQLERSDRADEVVREDDPDAKPEFDKVQQPPVALDDEFGARPGRSTILPVLLNDYDPNGDVLMVSQVSGIQESVGSMDLIDDNQHVQLTLPDTARGTISFGYTVTDGRGGEANATVTVTVRTPQQNAAPKQVRRSTTVVAAGGRVATPVLGDWVDPDGDAIYLSAAATASPDVVSYQPDGTVVFVEGGSPGVSRSVTVTVTDGTASSTGQLAITVGDPGEVPIITDPFAVLAYAGREVQVQPLEHVRGGTGTLRLSSVADSTAATIVASPDLGTFRFTNDQAGTFIIDYVVTDGDQTATGSVRIDVASPPNANTKPITVPKTIFVNTLSTETVDVASSDIDPSGGVLLVTGVDNVGLGDGIQVEIVEQRALRVTLTAIQDDGPVTFNYRVTNGLAESIGVVTVIEIPRPTQLQPPIATDDTISVRVGAAINIPVLDNDVQPDGETLTLDPQLTTNLARDSGLLFASGDLLRYLAPDKPGNFTASYSVSGPDGQSAQAEVRIAVREKVDATNNGPIPVTVTGRVVAGESVSVRIPLTGIDPDGDSVQLLGQNSNPAKGAVTPTGSDGFTYTAGAYSAGTDSFTYTVIDDLGARATGTVRVGISQPVDGARNPVAIADEVSMRPGGTVTIRVLDNDSDPDGSPLTVVDVNPTNDDTVLATTDGTVVTVTPPEAPGQYGLIYTIQNETGGTNSNFLTVTVSEDAPRARPIANDTILTLTDILGRDSINVNVLTNVFFADGPVNSLDVGLLSGYDSAAEVTADKRVAVTVGQTRQIIPFSVTNPHDPSIVSYAFVWVPGYDDALPQVNRKAKNLEVASESTLVIPINDHVIAIGGKTVRLTDSATVQATHSDGSNLVVDEQTLTFRSADKYFGPASISFEVTDGVTADDPDGRHATIVLPITVTPRENQPPIFNGAVIDFEPAQEKVIDLLRLTDYPYPDDIGELAYTALSPLPVGFSYTLTGPTLTIRADADAVKGTTTALILGVRDDLEEGRAGTIELNVVASTRPLAIPAADSMVTPRGKTTVVDVLANDAATNPFPDQPLTVIGVRGIDEASLPPGVSIAPSANLSSLSVTVAPDAKAQDVNVQYQVADATNDSTRYVWGAVRLQIQDVPDPVTGVRVTSFANANLTIAWSPGAFNNSPITGYEVTATSVESGSVVSVTSCAVTNGCDIATAGNGPANQVRVTVVAINSIGGSDPAGVGRVVWSDVLPAAPGGITATPTSVAPAGGSLAIGWIGVPDPDPGTAVSGYTVRITGAGVDISRLVPATVNTLDINNSAGQLVPGNSYAVSVYARNSAQVSGEGAWLRNPAVSVTAVGPPGQTTGGVTGVVTNSLGHIQLTWGASPPQGAPGVSYSVERFDSVDVLPTTCAVATPGTSGDLGSALTWTDTGVEDQHTYRYVVYADNGYYCTPTASGEILTMRPPGKASGSISLQPRNGQWDIQVGNDLSVASLTAAKFQYRVNGAGSWSEVTALAFLTSMENSAVYGTPMTITFRGCRDASDAFCGEPSDGTTLTPVNARASILSCVIGEVAVANPPVNAGNPTVTFEYSFDRGNGFGPFTPDASVPEPIVPVIGVVTLRVRAIVDFGSGAPEHPGNPYYDPQYAEATCTG